MDLCPSFLISSKVTLSCEMSSNTFSICSVTEEILSDFHTKQESAGCAHQLLFKQALSCTPNMHLGTVQLGKKKKSFKCSGSEFPILISGKSGVRTAEDRTILAAVTLIPASSSIRPVSRTISSVRILKQSLSFFFHTHLEFEDELQLLEGKDLIQFVHMDMCRGTGLASWVLTSGIQEKECQGKYTFLRI